MTIVEFYNTGPRYLSKHSATISGKKWPKIEAVRALIAGKMAGYLGLLDNRPQVIGVPLYSLRTFYSENLKVEKLP